MVVVEAWLVFDPAKIVGAKLSLRGDNPPNGAALSLRGAAPPSGATPPSIGKGGMLRLICKCEDTVQYFICIYVKIYVSMHYIYLFIYLSINPSVTIYMIFLFIYLVPSMTLSINRTDYLSLSLLQPFILKKTDLLLSLATLGRDLHPEFFLPFEKAKN